MLKMKYIGDRASYPVEFRTVSANVVELKGDFPIKNDGFTLSRLEHKDGWDYSNYTTVYREIENGVQFSNDKSVYVEPEPTPELPNTPLKTYEPTLEELEAMEQRRKESVAIPTNAELSEAIMELAENISDIEDAIAELGKMM